MSLGGATTVVPARELARLIVEGLNLEGVSADQLDLLTPLFNGGLDLDSLDMLEISLIIQQHFGVKLKADDPENEANFASLQSLANHVNSLLSAQD